MGGSTKTKLIDFAAGASSGLVADGVTHPIDTIRTRLWVQGATNDSAGAYRYGGLLNGFVTMVRNEGVVSLFKGFGSVALLTPLAHGLYFGSYEWAKQHLIRKQGNLLGVSDTTAIMTAAFIVKQKQQALVGQLYNGPLDGLRQVYAEGGMRKGLMRGYMSGLATYGPFSAIYFLTYERFKTFCLGYTPELRTEHFVAGGFMAGTVAAVATAPIDLIKTRIQVCPGYNGVVQSFNRIWREEGVAVFTKGIGARVIWVAPGCAITIAIFEDVGAFLKRTTSVIHRRNSVICEPAPLYNSVSFYNSVPLVTSLDRNLKVSSNVSSHNADWGTVDVGNMRDHDVSSNLCSNRSHDDHSESSSRG
eukprot:CAMPEP_0179415392 /NCGR_PEP_ID=MMETSP0799-20121207/6207_1 /TAXON_ID=46947 /ORGANISM="Geminigera cryophila, Strain CCMP2564" /LENGTH=360 /DNA_ID=CAMNT_0021188127 /DNA_START=329 /DNA_END=1408 /DNA_ORIENTATION=+